MSPDYANMSISELEKLKAANFAAAVESNFFDKVKFIVEQLGEDGYPVKTFELSEYILYYHTSGRYCSVYQKDQNPLREKKENRLIACNYEHTPIFIPGSWVDHILSFEDEAIEHANLVKAEELARYKAKLLSEVVF
jgi:hypothetical protein